MMMEFCRISFPLWAAAEEADCDDPHYCTNKSSPPGTPSPITYQCTNLCTLLGRSMGFLQLPFPPLPHMARKSVDRRLCCIATRW